MAAAAGREVTRGGRLEDHEIPDVAATALAFAGVPATGLDGRTIEQIAGRSLNDAGDGSPAIARAASGMTSRDLDEVAQHLRDLGYIE